MNVYKRNTWKMFWKWKINFGIIKTYSKIVVCRNEENDLRLSSTFDVNFRLRNVMSMQEFFLKWNSPTLFRSEKGVNEHSRQIWIHGVVFGVICIALSQPDIQCKWMIPPARNWWRRITLESKRSKYVFKKSFWWNEKLYARPRWMYI